MKVTAIRLALLVIIMAAVGLSWGCAPPTVKLKVSRDEVNRGDPVTVSWESKKAKTVELNGQKVEKIGAQTMTPDQTTTYELVARRGKKQARDSATIKVITATAPAPAITLTAEPGTIDIGQTATLRWSAENATTVNISGLGEVGASGEREVSPRESTTYTAEVRGDGGVATASARVTVTEPAPPSIPAPEPAESPRTSEPAIEVLFANAVAPVFFDFDKSTLGPAEQEKLRRAADWLLQEQNRLITFRIEGNCDPRGTAEYNMGLGDRRARAARDFLISLSVEAHRIETVSYGLEKAQGRSEGAPNIIPSWAHDRRADFVYLGGGVKP
jgi:peptidoglycan-associated lipoprotein